MSKPITAPTFDPIAFPASNARPSQRIYDPTTRAPLIRKVTLQGQIDAIPDPFLENVIAVQRPTLLMIHHVIQPNPAQWDDPLSLDCCWYPRGTDGLLDDVLGSSVPPGSVPFVGPFAYFRHPGEYQVALFDNVPSQYACYLFDNFDAADYDALLRAPGSQSAGVQVLNMADATPTIIGGITGLFPRHRSLRLEVPTTANVATALAPVRVTFGSSGRVAWVPLGGAVEFGPEFLGRQSITVECFGGTGTVLYAQLALWGN